MRTVNRVGEWTAADPASRFAPTRLTYERAATLADDAEQPEDDDDEKDRSDDPESEHDGLLYVMVDR